MSPVFNLPALALLLVAGTVELADAEVFMEVVASTVVAVVLLLVADLALEVEWVAVVAVVFSRALGLNGTIGLASAALTLIEELIAEVEYMMADATVVCKRALIPELEDTSGFAVTTVVERIAKNNASTACCETCMTEKE